MTQKPVIPAKSKRLTIHERVEIVRRAEEKARREELDRRRAIVDKYQSLSQHREETE